MKDRVRCVPRKAILGALLSLTGASPAVLAAPPRDNWRGDPRLELSPQVGSGSLSSGEAVRHATGYGLGMSVPLDLPWLSQFGVVFSPRIDLSNVVVSAEKSREMVKSVLTYDNRILTGGFTVSRASLAPSRIGDGLYASAGAGRAFTKLTADESAPRTFKQSLYGGISGSYLTGEVGTWIALKEDFGLSLAVVGSTYQADQSRAKGTFEGEELAPDDSLFLVTGSNDGASSGLPARIRMTTYTAKLGLLFQF